MKTEELVRGLPRGLGETYICEECVHLLVTDKPRWLLLIEDILHAIGEIAYVVGKWLAMLILGAQYLLEAVFPHLNRQKTPQELEAEREQREWEEERERNAQEEAISAVRAEGGAGDAHLGSIKADFKYSGDRNLAAELEAYRNRLTDRLSDSPDPYLDQVYLRKNTVEAENLHALESARNQRRRQLQDEEKYHKREQERWEDRARAVSDSKEEWRYKREAEHHKMHACHAKTAYENI